MKESQSEARTPQLSIIVLNWNLGSMTEECIAEVRAHTEGIDYEIIVVDNGSNPEQKHIVRRACNLHDARLVELGRNLSFGEANNIGVEASKGRFVLLLNNDVLVTPGYLQPLLHAFETAHRIGVVGPELRYPGGRLQEAGGYVRSDGWTIRHGLIQSVDVLSTPGLHIADYCSAACVLLRRDVFLRVGGFDPVFDPAYFEDVDLMLRIRALGLFTYYCGGVSVVHRESATMKAMWDKKRRRAVLRRNHQRFFERWGDFLKARLFSGADFPSIEQTVWSAEPSVKPERSVFLQGSGLIDFSNDWRDIFRIASAISEETHVVFVTEELSSRCRVYAIARHWNERLGEFSVKKAADIEPRLVDTVAIFGNSGSHTEATSGSGPLWGRICEVLARMNSSRH